MLADPREVVLAERGARHDPEAIAGQTRHGEVALDAAARVQHLRVGHLADVARDAVRAEPLEESRSALPGHEDLRERALVEDRRGLTARPVLGPHGRRPELARPAARPQRLVPVRGIRLEPVRALPPGLLAERGSELLQPRIRRRHAERAPRGALVARVLDVVVGLVDLLRARQRVRLAAVGGAEAPRVHVPDVEGGRALDDPLGDELPHPAGARQSVRAEAGRDPEAADVGRPQDELAVRRERLRAVDELHDLHLAERRDPHDRVLHELLEPRPVLLEEPRVEVRRDAVEPPRRAVPLVAAHDQPARLRPEVDEKGRVSHRRHVGRETGRLCDEVLVRHRHDRDVDPRQRADLARVHATCVDDDRRRDRAPIRLDARDATALDRDSGDACPRRDLGAAPPRALCQREGELARVDIAVGRQERRPQHAVRRHRRKPLLRLRGRDQLEREAERLRPAGLARDLLHPLGGRREAKRAHLVPSRLEPDLVLERAVQVDALHHHPRERERSAKLPDQAGGMERRAARELGPLHEDDVVPAEPRQPVEDRAAADAASDHHGLGAVAHARSLVGEPAANCEKFLRWTPLIGHVSCHRFLPAPSTGRR